MRLTPRNPTPPHLRQIPGDGGSISIEIEIEIEYFDN